jgi:hypothetical protein
MFRWKHVVKQSNDIRSEINSTNVVTTSSIEFNDSEVEQVLQDCNFTWSIQLSPVLSDRKENENQKAREMDHKRI